MPQLWKAHSSEPRRPHAISRSAEHAGTVTLTGSEKLEGQAGSIFYMQLVAHASPSMDQLVRSNMKKGSC